MNSAIAKAHGNKLNASQRRTQLAEEIQSLVRERGSVRDELDTLRAELSDARSVAELTTELQQLRAELEAFRATGVDPAEVERLKTAEAERIAAEKTAWEAFLQRCEAMRHRHPDFDACLSSLSDLPASWLRTISALEQVTNPA